MLQGTPASLPEPPDTTTAGSASPIISASTPSRRSTRHSTRHTSASFGDVSVVELEEPSTTHATQPESESAPASKQPIESQAEEAEEGEEEDGDGDEEPDGESLGGERDEDAAKSATAGGGEDSVVQSESGTRVLDSSKACIAANTKTKKGSNFDYIFTCYSALGRPPKWNKDEMWYLVYQREICPTTGREHWQGFVQFMARMTYKQGMFYLACGHVSMYARKGTPAQCRKYCSKDETRMIGTSWVEQGFIQPRTRGVNPYALSNVLTYSSDESLLNDNLCADYVARGHVELSTIKYKGKVLCATVTHHNSSPLHAVPLRFVYKSPFLFLFLQFLASPVHCTLSYLLNLCGSACITVCLCLPILIL